MADDFSPGVLDAYRAFAFRPSEPRLGPRPWSSRIERLRRALPDEPLADIVGWSWWLVEVERIAVLRHARGCPLARDDESATQWALAREIVGEAATILDALGWCAATDEPIGLRCTRARSALTAWAQDVQRRRMAALAARRTLSSPVLEYLVPVEGYVSANTRDALAVLVGAHETARATSIRTPEELRDMYRRILGHPGDPLAVRNLLAESVLFRRQSERFGHKLRASGVESDREAARDTAGSTAFVAVVGADGSRPVARVRCDEDGVSHVYVKRTDLLHANVLRDVAGLRRKSAEERPVIFADDPGRADERGGCVTTPAARGTADPCELAQLTELAEHLEAAFDGRSELWTDAVALVVSECRGAFHDPRADHGSTETVAKRLAERHAVSKGRVSQVLAEVRRAAAEFLRAA